jgi:hypothetical protein
MITSEPNLPKKAQIDATLSANGDKRSRVEILRDLGPGRYSDLDKIYLEYYLES